MEIFVLLLLLLILAPGVLGFLIVPLAIAIGVLLLAQLLFHSVAMVVLVPRSLLWAAVNKRVRQNHALEHATVNVIEEKIGRTNLSGYAVKDGFKLYGTVELSPEFIFQAAQLGLARLKSGEHSLVVHQRCGTSLLMTNFMFALLIIATFVGMKFFNIFYFIAALIAINLLAKPLGRFTQKYITTSADVRNITITELEVRTPSGNPFLRFFFREFYIQTERRQPIKVFAMDKKTDYGKIIPISSP